MDWLITGTGRCGTGYVAMVLQSAGVNCGHEAVFNHAGLEHAKSHIDQFEADASWLAAPYLEEPIFKHVKIVHLIRHPKRVIDSLVRMAFWTHDNYAGYRLFARNHCPEVDEWERPEDKAAAFYFAWRFKITSHADITHHIEDDVRGLLDKMGVDYAGKPLFSDKKYNTRGISPTDVHTSDLAPELADKMRAITEQYHYAAW